MHGHYLHCILYYDFKFNQTARVFFRLFSNISDTVFILYLPGVFQFVFFSFKPQWIYHSGIQYGHYRYRDKTKKKEAGDTVCLGQPRFRPEFHAEIGFLIKTDCEEQWTDKDGCRNPQNRNDDLLTQANIASQSVMSVLGNEHWSWQCLRRDAGV